MSIVLTVVFGVPSDTQPTCLDGGEAKANGLAQGGSIDVGDIVVVTDSAVRIVETLTRDVAVWVRGVICREPEGQDKHAHD